MEDLLWPYGIIVWAVPMLFNAIFLWKLHKESGGTFLANEESKKVFLMVVPITNLIAMFMFLWIMVEASWKIVGVEFHHTMQLFPNFIWDICDSELLIQMPIYGTFRFYRK